MVREMQSVADSRLAWPTLARYGFSEARSVIRGCPLGITVESGLAMRELASAVRSHGRGIFIVTGDDKFSGFTSTDRPTYLLPLS